jgi:mRNA-degrading endonuclease RelE of RelBE toxin-antitoxin system
MRSYENLLKLEKMEKTTTAYKQQELLEKRKELILKVLGQLYKGKIGGFNFRKNGDVSYAIGYCTSFGPHIKEQLLKNIHDIAKKFSEQNLSILEFLMDNMDMEWEVSKKSLKEIEENIEKIKQKCMNYLLIMLIEESND